MLLTPHSVVESQFFVLHDVSFSEKRQSRGRRIMVFDVRVADGHVGATLRAVIQSFAELLNELFAAIDSFLDFFKATAGRNRRSHDRPQGRNKTLGSTHTMIVESSHVSIFRCVDSVFTRLAFERLQVEEVSEVDGVARNGLFRRHELSEVFTEKRAPVYPGSRPYTPSSSECLEDGQFVLSSKRGDSIIQNGRGRSHESFVAKPRRLRFYSESVPELPSG